MILSVVIPSYKDPCLRRTVEDLLAGSGLGDRLEIIITLDGYWPSGSLVISDPRVRYLHLGRNRGMRGAINAGMAVARGDFVMKADEHCRFQDGFDKDMVEACQQNWVVTALRYGLDIDSWECMEGPPICYEKLLIIDGKRFAAVRWRSRDRDRDVHEIDETMSMQGSCYLMTRSWWEGVVGPLQEEGYGPFANEAQEISFKTWQAGGSLMVNKNTWYAHRHRSFGRTHKIRSKDVEPGWRYSLDLWGDYYRNEILPRWEGSGRAL